MHAPSSLTLELSKLSKFEGIREFDSRPLHSFLQFRRGNVVRHLKLLSQLPLSTSHSVADSLTAVFGNFGANHSLARSLELGFSITEPQATRGLAHLLNTHSSKVLRAFLQALEVPLDYADDLNNYEVRAEHGRVDLEILLPIIGSKDRRPVMIEAKFGHHITIGQLKNYVDSRRKESGVNADSRYCIILGLDRSAVRGLKGRQVNQWHFVSWRNLWLRFERKRPTGLNDDAKLLMRMLWTRIGS